MIDTKEIRAGNWVMTGNSVKTVSETQPVYKLVKEDEYRFTFASHYFPIPLSADILGKSSFRYAFGNWFKNLDAEGIENGLPFLRYNQKAKQWYLFERRLPFQPVFLHQLQNLYYALTNKELPITLQQMPANHAEHTPIQSQAQFFNGNSL
jgi:hypothetical protein